MAQSQKLTREYRKDFKKVFTSVSQASDLFQDDEIWPGQCDRIVDSMQCMSKLAQHLYQLLDADAARTADPPYHQLLETLRSIEKLLNHDLIPYIKAFRVICRTSSIQTIRQRQRIRYKLELLLYHGKNALNDITLLLDQIRFEERKLETVH